MRSTTRSEQRFGRRAVTIGLVNNMGDEALKGTERQFGNLVAAAAGDIDVEFRLFALERTPRSPQALKYISERYAAASEAMDGGLDALIITGAQPRAAFLADELYWEELTELIDWAKEHTASTIFSCLAAHAAVLHLDGIERRLLQRNARAFSPSPFKAIIPLRASNGAPALFRTLGITPCCGVIFNAPATTFWRARLRTASTALPNHSAASSFSYRATRSMTSIRWRESIAATWADTCAGKRTEAPRGRKDISARKQRWSWTCWNSVRAKIRSAYRWRN